MSQYKMISFNSFFNQQQLTRKITLKREYENSNMKTLAWIL